MKEEKETCNGTDFCFASFLIRFHYLQSPMPRHSNVDLYFLLPAQDFFFLLFFFFSYFSNFKLRKKID